MRNESLIGSTKQQVFSIYGLSLPFQWKKHATLVIICFFIISYRTEKYEVFFFCSCSTLLAAYETEHRYTTKSPKIIVVAQMVQHQGQRIPRLPFLKKRINTTVYIDCRTDYNKNQVNCYYLTLISECTCHFGSLLKCALFPIPTLFSISVSLQAPTL
jgi:hypothetical protein